MPPAETTGPGRPARGRRRAVALAGVLVAAGCLFAVWRWQPLTPGKPAATGPDDPRLTFATPYRNVRPDIRYVGDATCADCHPTQAETYREHPMGRSFAPVASEVGRLRYDESVHNPFRADGLEFLVERRGDRLFHRQTCLDAQGRPLASAEEEVQYVIGSGEIGYSYFVDRGGGSLFFSPISWYRQPHRWDQSPGRLESYLAGRPVSAECLFCHTNFAHAVPGTINRYREPIFEGYRIGCERCHGPGELHVQRRERGEVVNGVDDTIVNPARLEPALREAVCQQCHLEGTSRVLRRGRDVFDFRPGLPLDVFWSVLVGVDTAETADVVSHVEQMYVSRCFRASGGKMGCISCHDPHAVPADKVAHYRARCLNCHENQGCRLPVAVRRGRQPDDSCAACHMPRTPSGDVVHAAITDHRIRRPGEPARRKGQSAARAPGMIPLKHFASALDPRDPEVGRDLGLGLVDLARRFDEGRAQLTHMAFPLVRAAATAHPDDVAACRAYAYALTAQDRFAEANSVLEAALPHAGESEALLKDLAYVSGMLGRPREAIGYWRRVLRINPWFAQYRLALAEQLAEVAEWAEAAENCRVALRFNPSDAAARRLLIQAALRTGDRAQARKELEFLLAVKPEDAEELRRWFAGQGG
jgi:Flp pilus assembly protein TadD